MIQIAGNSSEDCKFLSNFGNKWSTKRPLKYHKFGNTDIEQEDNIIVAEAVESAIHEKKKINKKKWKFCEME